MRNCQRHLSVALSLLVWLSGASSLWAQEGALIKNIEPLRAEMNEVFNQVTSRWEAKLPADAFRQVKMSDVSTVKMVDTAHPSYQGIRDGWVNEMNTVRSRYNALDTRPFEVKSVLSKGTLRDRLMYTGTPRTEGCLTTDVDMAGSYEACEEFVEVMKNNNTGLKVEKLHNRFRIDGKDITLFWEEPPLMDGPIDAEYRARVARNAGAHSDTLASEGGKAHVSKGKLGMYDPEGAVAGHTQKFVDSDITRNPQRADHRTAAKSVEKAAEIAGTKANNPEFFETTTKLRNHVTPKEAGMTTFGNSGEAELVELEQWTQTAREEMVKAHKGAKTLTAEAEAVRTRNIRQYEAMGELTLEQQAELTQLKSEQMRTRLSRQTTLETVAVRDPELVSEMMNGEPITKTVNKNGSVTYTDAQGRVLSQSELVDAVMAESRMTTSGRVKAGVRSFLGEPPPTGMRARFVKGAGGLMLVYMVYEGISRSYQEYDAKDETDVLYLKSAGKAVWYGTGIPGVIDMGWEAGTDRLAVYYLDEAAGKNPSLVRAQLEAGLISGYRLVKGMTVDPLLQGAEAVKALDGLRQDRATWTLSAEEARAQQAFVENYRDQMLDKSQRRLEAILNRAETLKKRAEAAGDTDTVQRAEEVMRETRLALTKIKTAREGKGTMDERVAIYNEARQEADDVTVKAVVFGNEAQGLPVVTVPEDPSVAGIKAPEDDNFGLPEGPVDPAKRESIIQWRDESIASLQKQRETDPLRAANRVAALKDVGKPKKLTCKRCGFSEEHWWFGDRWSCPGCELVTMPSDVLRANGQTYRDYAAERMKVYDDKIQEIRLQSNEMLKALD